MTVETLRRAAALMRERAEKSSPSDGVRWGDGRGYSPLSYARQADAEHIASWHPAVALRAADALEQSAKVLTEAHDTPLAMAMTALTEPLVDLARTYLGES